MSTPVRLAAFLGLLVLVGLAGLGVGRAVGPVGEPVRTASHDEPAAAAGEHTADGHSPDEPAADERGVTDGEDGHAEDGHGGGRGAEAPVLSGLAVSLDGYTLRPETTTLPVGTSDFRFVVHGADGRPLRDYGTTHEKELHLIVVRRDGTGFQHLHPVRDDAGSWSTALTLPTAGAYRVYADFAPVGRPARTLATDLLVPGEFVPAPPPAPSSSTTVDGYEVDVSGGLDSGTLTFTVSRGGVPVDDLEPYLGAAGHLVVLREGDLGYLHVHPVDEAATGPDVAFEAAAPSAGRYRVYLQFQHGGAVRTAELTTEAREAA